MDGESKAEMKSVEPMDVEVSEPAAQKNVLQNGNKRRAETPEPRKKVAVEGSNGSHKDISVQSTARDAGTIGFLDKSISKYLEPKNYETVKARKPEVSGFFNSLNALFSPAKFRFHRLWGIVYLFQFFIACFLEIRGTPDWRLLVSVPLTGIIQSIAACRIFKFLPNANDSTQGYYHATKSMSFDFIFENVYFAGLLLFQSCYMAFNKTMRANIAFLPIEIIMTFFPYYTVRTYFPKSSFRNSTKEGDNMFASITKYFYITAKHFSGYYVNYMLFLGALGDDPMHDWPLTRRLVLLATYGTTIAVFLKTLSFRGYISPRTSMLLYIGIFPLFWTGYAALFATCFDHAWITILAFIGIFVNYGSWHMQVAYQTLVCALCIGFRYEFLQPDVFSKTLGALRGEL